MNSVKILNRVVLVLLEGPRRPCWLVPLIWITGLGLIIAWLPTAMPRSTSSIPLWPWPTVTLLPTLVASWWIALRFAKRKYYKRLAVTTDHSRCPACGYSFIGAETRPPPRCSECGVDPIELVAHAKRLTQ